MKQNCATNRSSRWTPSASTLVNVSASRPKDVAPEWRATSRCHRIAPPYRVTRPKAIPSPTSRLWRLSRPRTTAQRGLTLANEDNKNGAQRNMKKMKEPKSKVGNEKVVVLQSVVSLKDENRFSRTEK